jgi:phosphatidate cytidylyltransferase
MLKTRLITGSALFIVFVPILFFAPLPVLGFALTGLLGCAAWEWARLLKLENRRCVRDALSVSVIFILLLNVARNAAPILYLIAAVFWLGIAPLTLVWPHKLKRYLTGRTFLRAAGPFVLIASGYALLSARAFHPLFAFSVLLFVWAADSGAYCAGKGFGKHKIAPSISPGKSWEGALGGILFAYAAALAMQRFETSLWTIAVERLGIGGAAIACAALFVLSVMGDLFESLLKRQAGVKDSGALLPGHGGVLDRIDALLPVLPFAAWLIH